MAVQLGLCRTWSEDMFSHDLAHFVFPFRDVQDMASKVCGANKEGVDVRRSIWFSRHFVWFSVHRQNKYKKCFRHYESYNEKSERKKSE